MEPAAPPTESVAIEMREVSFGSLHNPDAVVLEEVNWTVHEREFWVLGGMQGSGRSDFLAMTAGLMPPTTGTYTLFGEPMPIYGDERLPQRLRLGLVFNDGRLLHRLGLRENIALPLRYHAHFSGADLDQRLAEILEATDLTACGDVLPGAVERAVQKRAGLARALTLEPDVLLLDNPLGGLDLRQAEWWLGFLRQLSAGHPVMRGKRLTLIATTGDLRPWRTQATHFAVLRQKKFISLGPAPQLSQHQEPLVRELLAEHLPASG